MPANAKNPRHCLSINDMQSYETMLYAEALKNAKKSPSKKAPPKATSRTPKMPSSRAACHSYFHISHKRLTELCAEFRRKRYKFISTITHPKKEGHRQVYTLVATKEWWSPDLEYFYRLAQQTRRNDRRRLLRKMRKEAESST